MSQTNVSHRHDRDIWKMSLALGIGVMLIYLAFLKPGICNSDGSDMLQVAKSLVTKQSFAVPPGWPGSGVLGRDGQYYSTLYPLLPIFAIPFVAIGLALAHVFNLPAHYVAAVSALVLSVLLTASTSVLVALLALRLGSTKQMAYLAALSFAFGTIALVYAQEFFAEPLLAFLTVVSLYLIIGETKREYIVASILAGLAVTAKPAGVVVGPVLSAYLLAKKRPLRIAVAPLIGTGMGVMLYLAYNYMRFGSLLSFGQNASNFGVAGVHERFFGMLFGLGAGGGLFWYCPPVILAVVGFRKTLKSKTLDALVIVAVFFGYLILHSFWQFGGWNWGPRFLVPVLPGLLALTAQIGNRWRKALLILTVLGFLVNVPTLLSCYERYYAEAVDGGYIEQALALWAAPADAPIVQAWGAAYRQVSDALQSNVKDILAEAGTPETSGKFASAQILRVVTVWWWVLPAVGISLWVGVALAFILMGAGVWLLLREWAYLRVRREK